MNDLKFEIVTPDYKPLIKRLRYNDVYIYIIIHYPDQCTCCYCGEEETLRKTIRFKVRKYAEKKEDCELILTKTGRTKIKLMNDVTEEEAIKIYNENY